MDLLDQIREQHPEIDVAKVRYAYYMAEQAHAGQTRDSGEPYITHPLAVARILAELEMDEDTIVAALLHDVIEDTETSRESISKQFGSDVLALIEGVTKLKFQNLLEGSDVQRARAESTRAAENLRKMLLAMAKDFRVIIIKLADRLHNMQTLDALPPVKRTRIANETLDIYAPLAARLGIWDVKWQLEDAAFHALHPREFEEVKELVAKSHRQRESEIQRAIVTLRERLERKGMRHVEIAGRPKHLYSIFQKMVKQRRSFDDIHDLLALRVIVDEVSDCYLALGVVHELWMPIPGLFYDYIAKPKPNGYQSLHTKVMGYNGEPLEVQIRTKAMHRVAEHGVASHWAYKEGKIELTEAARLARLREQLFDWSSDAKMSSDFLRSLSTDLFSEQVFVFTPKGDVLDLPKESTPVDFAFRVHTQLGLTIVGAKVNGVMVPLNSKLQNGDVVQLITRSNATPSMDWMEFVKSAHARSKLKAYFRRNSREVDAERGKDSVARELKTQGADPKMMLTEDRISAILPHFDGCAEAIDLFAKVGSGVLSAFSVAARLRGPETEAKPADTIHTSKSREGRLTVTSDGVDNMLVKRARCCDPIPGDDVKGYVTRGRGIIIHRTICPNAAKMIQAEPERLLDLDWPKDGETHSVQLKITTVNRQGLLADVSTVFGEQKANISWAKIKTLQNNTAEIEIAIDVTDIDHLAQVMNRLSNYSDVISVLRMFGRTSGR
ncbi:MAG: bifunctional (p)ppGpp synthetase/guanosine-3',5'-bis(diphosphate) 3'-pyrophosphohydrolase [Armatimonadetes bacterium]|nr:bifunctional (p)ppGpp synthetase/guanosine-3',5'-bis(diphosphate) 3'-pyrophosphohydrolase [Armatimonadota bacterium]